MTDTFWRSRAALAGTAVLVLPAAALAQGTPPATIDPGAITRGLLEQQRQAAEPPRVPQEAVTGEGVTATDEAPESGGVSFVLNAVTFDPSSFLSTAELEALAAPRIGTEVTLADLRAIAAQVNALYAERGIITARAYVPPQRVADGVVRIALIEGRLGELQVAEGRYTSSDYARRRIDLTPGDTVDLMTLRRSVERFNRDNDARIQAQLQPGREPGLTDVLISLAEPPRNSAQLFVDTFGYESTGRYQGGLSLRRNAMLTDGDRLIFYGNLSEGGLTGSATYSVPIDSARLGISYARSQVAVKKGPSASLDIEGFSDTVSLNIARPIGAGDSWYVNAVAGGSYIASTNELAGVKVGETEVYRGTIGWAGVFTLTPQAALAVNHTVSLLSTQDSLDTEKRTFAILNADVSLTLALTQSLALRIGSAGQYTGFDFVPSNQLFQVGGPFSARGWQPGTTSGRSGFYTQTELQYAPKWSALPGLNLFTFLDAGRTYSPDFGSRGIGSAGLGLRLPVGRFDLEAFYGVPFTSRLPGEDGSRADARLVLRF